jgi:predicted Zn-dependent peptidase
VRSARRLFTRPSVVAWLLLALPAAFSIVSPSPVWAQVGPDPLVPDSILRAPGFPSIVRLPASAPGVVALRLSIPLSETAAESGAGRMLEILARDRIAGLAATLGAQVETGRTPWGIVYTVSGPAADLDYLVFLLREATRAPASDEATLQRVRLAQDEALRRLEETGGGRVEAALRAEVTPGHPPVEGTRGTVPRLSAGLLHDVWARSHRPEAMRLLVSGEAADPVLLATLAGLGAGPDVPVPPAFTGPAPTAPAPGRVETLRRWHGTAWSSPGPLDPSAALTAVLLARHLRRDSGDYEAHVRLWETAEHTVIAVVGAAYPARAGALSTRLDRLLSATATELEPDEVRDAAEAARRDLLLQARTPWGRVHLVGRFLDAGLGPRAAREYVDRLGDLDRAAVQAFLTALAATTAARAEVRP